MKKLSIVLGVLALCASLSAQATGALAIADNHAGYVAYGLSYGFCDLPAAQNAAIAKCESLKQSNNSATCAVVTWFTNKCSSIAAGTNNAYGWSYRDTSSDAASAAVTNCSNYGGTSCTVRDTACDGAAQ